MQSWLLLPHYEIRFSYQCFYGKTRYICVCACVCACYVEGCERVMVLDMHTHCMYVRWFYTILSLSCCILTHIFMYIIWYICLCVHVVCLFVFCIWFCCFVNTCICTADIPTTKYEWKRQKDRVSYYIDYLRLDFTTVKEFRNQVHIHIHKHRRTHKPVSDYVLTNERTKRIILLCVCIRWKKYHWKLSWK